MPSIDSLTAVSLALSDLREAIRDAEQREGWRLREAFSRAHTALGVLDFQLRRISRSDSNSDEEALRELRDVVRRAVALLDMAVGTAVYKDGLSTEQVVSADLLTPVAELLGTVSSD